MSIRYNRQYKMDADITGPIGPYSYDSGQNLDFLNNNDVYLRGGNFGGGGGGSSEYVPSVEPPMETPPVYVDPPIDTRPIDVTILTPENPVPDFQIKAADPIIKYELSISSNLKNEIGDFISLKYDIAGPNQTIDRDTLKLSSENTDGKSALQSLLRLGILNIYLENTLPSNYSIKKIYYANRNIAEKNPLDYTKWNTGDIFIGLPASELLTGGLAVAVIVEKVINQPKPWFNQFDVIFGDEAHQFKSKSLTTIMERLDNVKYRIGTTGTLDGSKVNKLVLEGIFGRVFTVTTTRELMDNKSVVELKISCLLLKYDAETRQALKEFTYQEEMNWLVTHPARNKFIRNLAISTKGNTLVLFQYVDKHGKKLYEMINSKISEGRKVFFVHGGVATTDREEIRTICEKENDAIIVASFGVFSTGINMPSIENIIFASPSKSKIRNLQSIGRGLRLKDGKTVCKLFDITDDLSWKSHKNHTLNHGAERYKLYMAEQFKTKMIEVNI